MYPHTRHEIITGTQPRGHIMDAPNTRRFDRHPVCELSCLIERVRWKCKHWEDLQQPSYWFVFFSLKTNRFERGNEDTQRCFTPHSRGCNLQLPREISLQNQFHNRRFEYSFWAFVFREERRRGGKVESTLAMWRDDTIISFVDSNFTESLSLGLVS